MKKPSEISFVYFGSSRFSEIVLSQLEKEGYKPILNITSSRTSLPSLEELRKLNAELFIVASFGKILPKELLDIPTHGSLNVHPSLLPQLRGPAPIQATILGGGEPAVTIIKMDEQMDHGPILAQEKVALSPWPDFYETVEEKLAQAGGKLLAEVIPRLLSGELKAAPQKESEATTVSLIQKEDGELDLAAPPEENLRKLYAYSHWPGVYFFFETKMGKKLRVVVKKAEISEGKFVPLRVIPEGKREMLWQDFLRGNA